MAGPSGVLPYDDYPNINWEELAVANYLDAISYYIGEDVTPWLGPLNDYLEENQKPKLPFNLTKYRQA